MKRYLASKNEVDKLNLNIDINYIVDIVKQEVAATEIRPVGLDKENDIIDEAAKQDFVSFVESVFEIISAYDFHIFNEYQRSSKSFPYTSEYRWVAHRTEIDNNSIPKLIRLRISEHSQSLSSAHQNEISDRINKEAELLKVPKNKLRQRWKPAFISVNAMKVKTYEEALHEVEILVRKWLTERGIDVEPYGDPIW